jgi:hypothetical protein
MNAEDEQVEHKIKQERNCRFDRKRPVELYREQVLDAAN